MQVTYHREAEEELIGAMIWYEQQQSGLSDRFLRDIQDVEAQIVESPYRWPEVEPGIRKLNADRFPYRLIYRVRSDAIEVLAVMHQSRNPSYWHHRAG